MATIDLTTGPKASLQLVLPRLFRLVEVSSAWPTPLSSPGQCGPGRSHQKSFYGLPRTDRAGARRERFARSGSLAGNRERVCPQRPVPWLSSALPEREPGHTPPNAGPDQVRSHAPLRPADSNRTASAIGPPRVRRRRRRSQPHGEKFMPDPRLPCAERCRYPLRRNGRFRVAAPCRLRSVPKTSGAGQKNSWPSAYNSRWAVAPPPAPTSAIRRKQAVRDLANQLPKLRVLGARGPRHAAPDPRHWISAAAEGAG